MLLLIMRNIRSADNICDFVILETCEGKTYYHYQSLRAEETGRLYFRSSSRSNTDFSSFIRIVVRLGN